MNLGCNIAWRNKGKCIITNHHRLKTKWLNTSRKRTKFVNGSQRRKSHKIAQNVVSIYVNNILWKKTEKNRKKSIRLFIFFFHRNSTLESYAHTRYTKSPIPLYTRHLPHISSTYMVYTEYSTLSRHIWYICLCIAYSKRTYFKRNEF